MPIYECQVCLYKTDRVDNYKRHQAKSTPCTPVDQEARQTYTCTKCDDRDFSQVESLNMHMAKCNGLKQNECDACHEVLPSKKELYVHKMKDCPALPPINLQPLDINPANTGTIDASSSANTTNTVDNSVTVTNDNSITNDNSVNITNNITIHLPPQAAAQVHDWDKTDIDQTIDDIVANPARIQLAYRKNLLHEAVAAELHFSGSKSNMNVFTVERHGTSMYVRMSDRRRAVDRKIGVNFTIQRVRHIVNSPRIKTLLSSGPDAILPFPETLTEARDLRSLYIHLLASEGDFIGRHSLVVPKGLPPPFNQAKWDTRMLEVLRTVQNAFRPDPLEFKDVIMDICERFMFIIDSWFVGIGTGWRLCNNQAEVENMMYMLLNDLKNDLVSRLATSTTKSDDVLKARDVLRRLPDKDLAKLSISWMIDRDRDSAQRNKVE